MDWISVKSSLLGSIVLAISVSGWSQKAYFEYSPLVAEVYQDIIDLKVVQAQTKLLSYSAQEPDNKAYHLMESYLQFFQLFISEEYNLYLTFKEKKEVHLKAIEELDKDDPYKRYALAEIKLQSALIRAKFDEVIGGSREMYSAYKLLKTNQK